MDEGKMIVGLIAGLALFLLLLLVDVCASDVFDRQEDVTVVHTDYTPSQTSTGVGTTTSGRAVVTTSTTDEVFSVVVKTADGDVAAHRMPKHEWAEVRVGDTLSLVHTRSKIFGFHHTRLERHRP